MQLNLQKLEIGERTKFIHLFIWVHASLFVCVWLWWCFQFNSYFSNTKWNPSNDQL